MNTIGVTGGTGLLGRAWIDRVLRDDPALRVLALVRPTVVHSPAEFLGGFDASYRERIELVAADFQDLHFSPRTLDRLASVDRAWWHLAAATNLATSSDAEAVALAVNTQGTARLLAAVHTTTPRTPFFHVSTAYVAGCRRGRITETPADPDGRFHNPYERSKALAESHVQRFFAAGGRGAILRPSLVLASRTNRGGGQLPDLCASAVIAALRRGEPEFHLRVSPDTRMHLVSETFVLDAFAAVAAHAETTSRIFHVTPATEMRFEALRTAIEAVVPLKVKFWPEASRGDLPDASRVFDRVLDQVRCYFGDELDFDRSNIETILPANVAGGSCDLPGMVARRLAGATDRSPSAGATRASSRSSTTATRY